MKYVTLDALKDWMRDTDPGSEDNDAALTTAIERAEEAIDCYCGSEFQDQSLTHDDPRNAWIDGNGTLWCHVNFPVRAVTAVQLLDIQSGSTTWQSIALTLPIVSELRASPELRNYRFRVVGFTPRMGSRCTGDILARVSYTAGWETIPLSLAGAALHAAHAFYIYRDNPTQVIVTTPLGNMALPVGAAETLEGLGSWRNLNL